MKKTILGLCFALSFQMLIYKGYQLNYNLNIEEEKTTTSHSTIEYNNEITITPVTLLKKDFYHYQQKNYNTKWHHPIFIH
jgi:hypothetical protein